MPRAYGERPAGVGPNETAGATLSPTPLAAGYLLLSSENMEHPPGEYGLCLTSEPPPLHAVSGAQVFNQRLLIETDGAANCKGGSPGPLLTLSFRKPILRMFSTPGTPSAIVRSPMESPSRRMSVLP